MLLPRWAMTAASRHVLPQTATTAPRDTAALAIESAGRTDVGRRRRQNEDQFIIVELERSLRVESSTVSNTGYACNSQQQGAILVVADGMGGHGGGDVASNLAVRSVVDYLCGALPWFDARSAPPTDPPRGVRSELSEAVSHSNRQVRQAASRGEGQQKMGTTLTLGYLTGAHLYLAHVGDSRAYRLRQGRLKRLTQDHTVAAEINAERPGTVPPDARWNHILTRAVGSVSRNVVVEPDVARHEVAAGDVVFLCSDGVTAHVDEETLATLLGSEQSCDEIARGIVHAANEGGGSDNITAVVARLSLG